MTADNHEQTNQEGKTLSPIAKLFDESPLTFFICLIFSLSFITGIFFGKAIFFTKFDGGIFSYEESPSLFILNLVFSGAIFSITISWLWHHRKPSPTQYSIQHSNALLPPFTHITLPPHRIVAFAFFAPVLLTVVAGIILWGELHEQPNVMPWIFTQTIITKIFGVGFATLFMAIYLWKNGATMRSKSQAFIVANAFILTVISWNIIQAPSLIVALVTSIWWWRPYMRNHTA